MSTQHQDRWSLNLQRIGREGRRFIKKTMRLVSPEGPDGWEDLLPGLQGLSHSAGGVTRIYGRPFYFLNKNSLLFLYDEIIRQQIYRFRTADTSPRIIDGGANIGMGLVYFKHLYPDARIVAFEPDPAAFATLAANAQAYDTKSIELRQEALWTSSGTQRFHCEPSTLGGRIDASELGPDVLSVGTQRLRDLLDQDTALLKLDVEGAETELLEDCGDALQRVEHLFVEYHSFADRPQTLHRLLHVVHNAGFRYHMHVFQPSPQPLLHRTIRHGIDAVDMNLDIFCFRV